MMEETKAKYLSWVKIRIGEPLTAVEIADGTFMLTQVKFSLVQFPVTSVSSIFRTKKHHTLNK